MIVTRAELWPYLRTPVTGGYRYEPVGTEHVETRFPPAVGDLISLPDDHRAFRVVGRHWKHAHTGSPQWKQDGADQRTALNLVVEQVAGLFTDEAPAPQEDQ